MTTPAMLLIWAVFAATLPPPTSQSCFKANESQCHNADFAPGSNLGGEGFDITTMQRKGAFVLDTSSWLQKDKTCTLCKNPYMGGQTQKLPVSVVDWRPNQKCSTKLSSSVYQSSEALVSASTSSIENDWKIGLPVITPKVLGSLILAGSNSKLAEYSMEKTKKDKFSFTSHHVSCGYYSYRVSGTPLLHPELSDELGSLPKIYDDSSKHLYYKLIDKFGTHYITKVTLGGEVRSVTSIKECEASLQGLRVDDVKTCLELEASLNIALINKLKPNVGSCMNTMDKILHKNNFASTFSDRETNVIGGNTQSVDLLFSSNNDPEAYKEWVSSLPAHPDVLSYSLEPLHELLPVKNPIRVHLRTAIKDYILQRALLKNEPNQCKTNSADPCSCQNNQNCCPKKKGFAEVTITVIKATDLYGDVILGTDAFVEIILNELFRQTSVIPNNNSPYWNQEFKFKNLDLTQYSSVELKVWDKDNNFNNDLLGICNAQLESGVKKDSCALNHGVLYYKVEVKCVHGLAGSSCMDYKPTPMDAELEKVYVSRNARPIPESMLQDIGVLLPERSSLINQSNIRKAKWLELLFVLPFAFLKA